MIISIDIEESSIGIVSDAYASEFSFNLDQNSLDDEATQKLSFLKKVLLNEIKRISEPYRIRKATLSESNALKAAIEVASENGGVGVVISSDAAVDGVINA